jgi:ribosomal RNA-processing protein 12
MMTGWSPDSESKLTSAALLRHDAVQGGLSAADIGQGDEDATGVTHKTFDTFASDWTQCTNVAFDKVIGKFKANNAGHKDMLAVLAAVTEVLKQEGGKETETEYFAALMTTLELTGDETLLSAVVRLLGLVIKRVPHPVLVSRYSQVNAVLLACLARHQASANVSLLRGLLGCLAVLLRVQPAAAWSLPEPAHSLASLLSFTAHPKPKLRKAGQHAVVSVVRGSVLDSPHPAAGLAAAHCQAVIAQAGPTDNTVLYMLALLRDVLPALPRPATKAACETVLKLLTLGSSVLVSTGFAALHGLFSARPAASCLPPEMNSQLVNALYDYQPGLNDGGPLVAWLAVQQEGLLNLAQQGRALAEGHLARYAQLCLACLLSEAAQVPRAAGLALRAVLAELGHGLPAGLAAKVQQIVLDSFENCICVRCLVCWGRVSGTSTTPPGPSCCPSLAPRWR